jgi:hypothetical protein
LICSSTSHVGHRPIVPHVRRRIRTSYTRWAGTRKASRSPAGPGDRVSVGGTGDDSDFLVAPLEGSSRSARRVTPPFVVVVVPGRCCARAQRREAKKEKKMRRSCRGRGRGGGGENLGTFWMRGPEAKWVVETTRRARKRRRSESQVRKCSDEFPGNNTRRRIFRLPPHIRTAREVQDCTYRDGRIRTAAVLREGRNNKLIRSWILVAVCRDPKCPHTYLFFPSSSQISIAD